MSEMGITDSEELRHKSMIQSAWRILRPLRHKLVRQDMVQRGQWEIATKARPGEYQPHPRSYPIRRRPA